MRRLKADFSGVPSWCEGRPITRKEAGRLERENEKAERVLFWILLIVSFIGGVGAGILMIGGLSN